MGTICKYQNKTIAIKSDMNLQTESTNLHSSNTPSSPGVCFYVQHPISSNTAIFSPPPSDNSFEKLLLREINEVRTRPKEYAYKLKSMMDYFSKKNNNSFCLSFPNTDKIILSHADQLFQLTIDYLQTIEPMQPLEWDERLKVNITEERPYLQNSSIFKMLIKKKEEIKPLYPVINFNIDFINHPITSCISQIIGDMNYNYDRRNVILNPHFSYFAVNYIKDPVRKFISISSFA